MLSAEDEQSIVVSSFELSANLRIEFLLILQSAFRSVSSKNIQLLKSNKNKYKYI